MIKKNVNAGEKQFGDHRSLRDDKKNSIAGKRSGSRLQTPVILMRNYKKNKNKKVNS